MNEQLRMEVVVGDRYTGPLRQLRSELQATTRIPGARVMSEDWKGLGVRVGSVTTALRTGLAPALYGVGTASLGVVSAVGAIALAIPRAVNAARDLHITSRELGVSFQKLRELGSLGKLFNMDEAQVKGDLQTFQDNLDQIRKGWGEAYGKLRAMNLGDLLAGLKNAPDLGAAVDQALEAIAKLPNPVRQREVAKALLGSEQWATVAREATPELREKIREALKDIPVITKEMANDFTMQTFRMSAAWDAMVTRLGVTFIPPITRAMKDASDGLKQLNDVVEAVNEGKWSRLFGKEGSIIKIDPNVADVFKGLKAAPPPPAEMLEQQKQQIEARRQQLAELDKSMQQLGKETTAYKRLEEQREGLARSLKALEEGLRRLQQQIDDATDPLKKMNFTAPGGGSILVPASLGGGGGGGGPGGFRSGGLRGGSFGLGGGGGAGSIPPMGMPGGGGAGSIPPMGTPGGGGGGGAGSIPPRGTPGGGGGGAADVPLTGRLADVPGNPFLAQQRAAMVDHLNKDPQARRDFFKGMALEERGGMPRAAAMETMFNRMAMTGQTDPSKELRSGFYGPVNRGGLRGPLSEADRRAGEEALKVVGAGSNITQGRTDQGMAGDPNAAGPGRIRVPGTTGIFNFWKGKRGGRNFSHDDSARFAAEQNRAAAAAARTPDTAGVAADEAQRRAAGDDMMGRAFGKGGVVGGGAVKVDGGFTADINLNGFPAGTKTQASTRGMFRNVVLNRGRQMGMAEDTPLAND